MSGPAVIVSPLVFNEIESWWFAGSSRAHAAHVARSCSETAVVSVAFFALVVVDYFASPASGW